MLCDKRVVFTVSPVRHLGDGLQENSVSKATLRLAVEELVERYQNCYYFPSFEILIDDLRDYRYYGEDFVHPSKMAIDYVWERFCEAVLSAEARERLPRIEQIVQAAEHRPFNPDSEAHKQFCHTMIGKIDAMNDLDFTPEREAFERHL